MKLTKENIQPYQPEQAIVIYRKPHSNYYLESHNAIVKDNQVQWSEGTPFKKESLKNLAIDLGNKSFKPLEIDGILPTELLYFKQTFLDLTMVWFLPPSNQKLHFSKELKIKSGVVNLPGFVFVAHKDELYIYAVKTNKRPDLNTRLYKAPFHNIYEDGEVCMGNVIKNKRTEFVHTEMERWQNRFFNSEFSHFLDENVIDKRYNLSLLFKNLMSKQLDQFPEEVLIDCKYPNLEALLNDLKK